PFLKCDGKHRQRIVWHAELGKSRVRARDIERPVIVLARRGRDEVKTRPKPRAGERSEEHTSELQSRFDLVCRLLLEKKKTCRSIAFLRCTCSGANPLLHSFPTRRSSDLPFLKCDGKHRQRIVWHAELGKSRVRARDIERPVIVLARRGRDEVKTRPKPRAGE